VGTVAAAAAAVVALAALVSPAPGEEQCFVAARYLCCVCEGERKCVEAWILIHHVNVSVNIYIYIYLQKNSV